MQRAANEKEFAAYLSRETARLQLLVGLSRWGWVFGICFFDMVSGGDGDQLLVEARLGAKWTELSYEEGMHGGSERGVEGCGEVFGV